ncbi:MAG: DUF2934 domain-containing protein [Rhizobium sp.]|nr:DUF2934 domain-containing protein [Rhizobium sp.]
MNNDYDQLIQQRAYAIWEREGRPDGRHDQHWKQAAQEMHGLEDAQTSAIKPSYSAPAGKSDRKR